MGVIQLTTSHYKTYFILMTLFLAGCTHMPRDGDFAEVERLVNERIPQKVHWYQGGEADAQVAATLEHLLKQPLTAMSAVQVALFNNRDLQSEYEDLGIAQADLVQAGLLSNPVLFSSIRFPKGGVGGNNVEFDLAKDFLDILLRPARQRMANTEFVRAKLRVANAVLKLSTEVQAAFYRVQGKRQLTEIMQLSADAAQTSYQLAQRFDEAGNLSELELAQERSAAAEMSAELLRSKAEYQSARDYLNGLLGLVDTERNWSLGRELPRLPDTDTDLMMAEDLALQRRLDLESAEREIEQITEALEITRDYRWLGGASVGVSTERDPDGGRVTGPNFSVEIPVFDQRQAAIARLESLLEQSKSRCAALKVTIQNDVRAAINHVNAARTLAEYYRDELVPAQQQVVKFTQQEQNYMLVDAFELLFVRQQATKAYRAYVEGLTDYWLARAELAHAIGIGLPTNSDDETIGKSSVDTAHKKQREINNTDSQDNNAAHH